MADTSESQTCEFPDCSRSMVQTAHKPHASTHGRESQSESESRLPDPDSQPLVLVPRPETQDNRTRTGDPKQSSDWKCEVIGCEFSTPTEADLNQKIKVMELHTRQAHPMTTKVRSGPRLVLALTVVIALLAVGFAIKETRDSRIAKEEWMKVVEEEAKEAKDANERTAKEARDAKERADKETQDAKEKEAQEQKDNAIRESLKVDFENFRNQEIGEQSSITVQEMKFLDLNEFHRCKYIEDVDAKQYDSIVENLAELMEFSDAQEKEIINSKYSRSLVNVVEDFKYTADIGIYTYGKYQTLRRPNGNLDITFAMHAFKWDVNQDQMVTKGNSDISDKTERDVAKLKSGAKLTESERKAWKNAFRAEAIGLFQKDCPPQLLSDVGLQEKERKEKEEYKHEKVLKDLDDKQQKVNNLEKEIKNLKEEEAMKDQEKSKDLQGKQQEVNDLKEDIKNLKEEEAKKQKENENLKKELGGKWF